ncbi:MAG: DNA repair protein RecO C-terminal domain-containing protein [Holosporales bacterium]|nr:DNA repair protein RecO C-terminal domain-containing protein [Holosporales bacterium]
MQFIDDSIILKIKFFSETSFIVTVISKNNGLHRGLLRKKNINLGDITQSTWTARLSEHLGTWDFESKKSCAAFIMRNNLKLKCFQFFCEILCESLPERMICCDIYEKSQNFIFSLCEDSKKWIFDFLLLELSLLPRVGFVLDFSDLHLATENDPLEFVSPKTGKIVTRSRGEPYKDKLLKFPFFFLKKNEKNGILYENIQKKELKDAFDLTHHFLFQNQSKNGNSLQEIHENLIVKFFEYW